MPFVIAVVLLKGGVSKTTTALALGEVFGIEHFSCATSNKWTFWLA
jgi:hypothetical protein